MTGTKDGLIGPNAVLQMIPVLEACQPGLGASMLSAAGLDGPPPDHGLMPEAPAARLHQAVRCHLPAEAPAIAAAAGRRTADYILAHRIPKPAQALLRVLPPVLSGPILSRAIAANAWSFAGSGRFRIAGPLTFEIAANPIVAGERADHPLCHWHAAVFERLFRELVDDRLRAHETGCCACADPACRFELFRPGKDSATRPAEHVRLH